MPLPDGDNDWKAGLASCRRLRALEQNSHAPFLDCSLKDKLRGLEVGPGAGFGIKVSVAVDAAHKHGAVALACHRPHIGRNIADRKADTSFAGPVGAGGVDQSAIVERNLPGLQNHVNRAGFVDFKGYFLAPGKNVIRREGIDVRSDTALGANRRRIACSRS